MARTKVFNVLEDKCMEEVMDKLNCTKVEAFSMYKGLTFRATLDYLKDTNSPHYDDMPDDITLVGNYNELFEEIYGCGFIESEYAYASSIRKDPEYGEPIQVRFRKVELLED